MSKRLTRAILALAVVSLTIGVAAMAEAQGRNNEFRVRLNGGAAHTSSHGRGSGTFKISSTGRSISYRLRATGLSGPVTAAHIHATSSGEVLIAICPGACTLPKHGTLTSSRFNKSQKAAKSFAAAIRLIRAGRTYVNIHTAKFKGGEIRGTLRADT